MKSLDSLLHTSSLYQFSYNMFVRSNYYINLIKFILKLYKEELDIIEDIRNLRLSKNITQEKLAEKAKISLRQLVRIEKGECRPNLETKILLFKALDISKNDIIDYVVKNYIDI